MKFDLKKFRTLGLATTAIVALPLGACSGLMGNDQNAQPHRSAQAEQAAPAQPRAFANGDENEKANGNVTFHGQRMSHSRVRALQQALNEKGASLRVDGIMGPNTRAALRNYQQQNGLRATGTIDQQTRQSLNLASYRNGAKSGNGQASADRNGTFERNSDRNADMRNAGQGQADMRTNGSSDQRFGMQHAQGREEVRQLQQALNANGASLQVDGVMGQNTRSALRNYQQQNGLQATGRIDQQTEQKLNIVSR